MVPNFKSISSRVSEPHVVESSFSIDLRYLPYTSENSHAAVRSPNVNTIRGRSAGNIVHATFSGSVFDVSSHSANQR